MLPETSAPPTATPRIQSVARAVAVLDTIARSATGTTAREISAEVGLSRATTYHLLQTLSAVGYVSAGDGRYRLALGISPLVQAFERHVLPEDLLPLARALASKTGESTYVAARRGAELNLLTSVPGHHQVAVATSPMGPIAHGHARASGKLLLALAPEDARERYLAAHPLQRITRRTITSRGALLEAFERIRSDGYAFDEEEYAEGVCCLAAPLGRGGVAYALVLSAPRERYEAHRDEYGRALLEVADGSLASHMVPRR
jgi:IclR family transcriptional regulator, acetate operon repressor